jgi:hypothetical protein
MSAMFVFVTVQLPSFSTWVRFNRGQSVVIGFDIFYSITYREVTGLVTVTVW